MMSATVTFKGTPLRLKGNLPEIGKKIPDCEVTDEELKNKKLSSFEGKALLILSVPSLDTSVCSKESRRFNVIVEKFRKELLTIVVSMDLPFAQKRWCTTENIGNLVTVSDFQKREFGEKFGVLIPDLGLLARCVFITDPELKLTYRQLVKEVTQEPDYEEVIQHITNQLAQIE